MMKLLWLSLAGLLASAQGYMWCDSVRGCYEVTEESGMPCCEHVYRDEHCPNFAYFPSQYGLSLPNVDPSYWADASNGIDEVTIELAGNETCDDFTTCLGLVQTVQAEDIDKGFNFLVNRDGRIFIGWGWDIIKAFRRRLRIAILAIKKALCEARINRALDEVQRFIQCIIDWLRALRVPRIFLRGPNALVELLDGQNLRQILFDLFCSQFNPR